MGRKVLRFDGALGPEGCGLPLCGNEFIMPPVGGKTVKPRLRHRSGDLLESPFMCRPGTNFARLGDPLQGLHMGNAPLLSPAATSPPEGEILAA